MNQVSQKSESVYERVIFGIRAGVYKVADKLPGERSLAREYQVSRNTIRQAFSELEDAGIIERSPRSGAFVSLDALQIILKRNRTYQLRVAFMMPPDQISNPVIQNIFTVFNKEIDPQIKIEVIFIEDNTKSTLPDFDVDLAVVFAIPRLKLLNRIRDKVKHMILLNTTHEDFNYIAPDNKSGGRLMAEYLLENGHRKIGGLCFNDKDSNSDFNSRMQGAYEVFNEAGIEFTPHLVKANYFLKRKLQKELHVSIVKDDYTAYIGGCDQLAVELYIALKAADRSVPKDVSVIGFDDQYYSAFISPALTTVKYPAEAIGIKLAEAAKKIMQFDTWEVQELIVPFILKRSSVNKIAN